VAEQLQDSNDKQLVVGNHIHHSANMHGTSYTRDSLIDSVIKRTVVSAPVHANENYLALGILPIETGTGNRKINPL
jgi:hypothetical protein